MSENFCLSTQVLIESLPLKTLLWFPRLIAEQEKVKPKKPIDLFADDDEDSDIFSEKYSAPTVSKKEAEKQQTKQLEKKVKTYSTCTHRLLWPVEESLYWWFIVVFRCRQGPSPCLDPEQKAYSVRAWKNVSHLPARSPTNLRRYE